MLGKLLKHEFKATGPIFLLSYIVVLALGGLGFLLVRLDMAVSLPDWVTVSAIMIYAFILGALLILTVVMNVVRFYRNLLSSEGYLMFTLPVKPITLVWSKLIVAAIWNVLSVVVIAASVFFVVLAVPDAWSTLLRLWAEINWAAIPASYIVQAILMAIAMPFSAVLSYYVCMAIGQLFTKYRVAAAVVAYIALSVVTEIISVIVGIVMTVPAIISSSDIGISFWPSVVMVWALNIAYFIVTWKLLDKKLNLV